MTPKAKVAIVAMVVLVACGFRSWIDTAVAIPSRPALSELPSQMGPWTAAHEGVLTRSVADVLKADDYVLRTYGHAGDVAVDIFVAYYKLQRAGETMHSPKNCLPGWGWEPVYNDRILLNRGGIGGTTHINRYVVEKNGDQAVVLYWYQAQGRVIASEYWGKVNLMWEALRSGRRDGAIVRLMTPVRKGQSLQDATSEALSLAEASFPYLSKCLPR